MYMALTLDYLQHNNKSTINAVQTLLTGVALKLKQSLLSMLIGEIYDSYSKAGTALDKQQ